MDWIKGLLIAFACIAGGAGAYYIGSHYPPDRRECDCISKLMEADKNGRPEEPAEPPAKQ